MSDDIGPVLVTGGTGTLGRRVVPKLLERGREVRVLSRRAHAADRSAQSVPMSQTGVPVPQWATGDLTTGKGLDAAVAGVSCIVHCATTGSGKDIDATRALIEAARRAGGRPHLVYVSIVGVDLVPLFYYRAKLAAEKTIEDCGLPWSILRTTQFHDLLARITTVQRRSPVTLYPAGMSAQPIEVDEVAQRLVELASGEPAGRVADMGGPEVHTMREFALLTLRAHGMRRPLLPVRLPGRAARAYRAGHHTTPGHAVGVRTYSEYLAAVTSGRAR
ncbi:SDR family oxidoreductase [Streptomyces ovatisporus]|uniref:SDR family oxidoreductase n=1 Tax=Streptomyces ovatisporus TaxID=1128682 RepID=A0ABV9AG85_9ACTN